jgi:hypothetical protein
MKKKKRCDYKYERISSKRHLIAILQTIIQANEQVGYFSLSDLSGEQQRNYK